MPEFINSIYLTKEELMGATQKAQKEMPRYQCHKIVHALKIKSIHGGEIIPADDGFAPFLETEEYIKKHNPQPGGYYVVYEDGYRSFSPASAFEQGYTRIN